MANSDETWWSQFGKMVDDSDGTTPEEVQALREYLDNPIDPAEAARRIMTLREDKIAADGEEWDKGTRISWFLWDVCIRFPARCDVILDLVEAIQAMTELEMTEEQRARFGEKWKEWTYLIDFDNCIRETTERYWESRYTGTTTWVSGLNLLSTWCVRNTQCFWELHNRGFITILTALEQDPWNHVPLYWQDKLETTPIWRCSTRPQEYKLDMLDTMILGVAPWIKIAGRLIYNYVDDEPNSILSDNKRRLRELKYIDSNLWHGKPYYSKERWAFWKERLLWVAQQGELKLKTRETATQLVDCMNAIEKDPQTEVWAGRVDRDPFG